MEDNDDSRIQRLNFRVEGNCIKNDDPPIPFYPIFYGLSPSDLLKSYTNFTNNHPDMEQVLVDIANTHAGAIFNPIAQVVLYAYYLNLLEGRGIQILPILNQLRKYSGDLVSLSGFESVLLVAYFLASEKHPFLFPDPGDSSIGSPLTALEEETGEGTTLAIKCHWVESQLRSWIQYCHLVRAVSPPTQNHGQDDEIPEVKNIVNQLQEGLIRGDIILLDEGVHVVEIMRDICPRALFCNTFSFHAGTIVFFGLQKGGELAFFETNLSKFLKKLEDSQPAAVF